MRDVLLWTAYVLVGFGAWSAVALLVGVIFGQAIRHAEELRQRKEAP